MKNSEQPVFPEQYKNQDGSIDHIPGISKREYMVTKILNGLLAGRTNSNISHSGICKSAIELTDELLKQLEA